MFNVTVDSILKGFAKTIEKLEVLIESKKREMGRLHDVIVKAEDNKITANKEAARAKAVADKLRDLIKG